MSSTTQPRRLFFWRHKAASGLQRPYRPVVECLEDRCLLSGGYAQVNLVSDVPGLARVTDPNLVNPWGIAFSPTGPFWFADNHSGVSDLLDGRGQAVPLVVTVPSAAGSGSSPTGTVFNGGPGFAVSENGVSAPSRFLFATEDGAIAGWSAVVDPLRALLAVDNSSTGAVYKGLALAADSAGQRFLYAADFSHGRIDVLNQDFKPVARPGSFQDPSLPAGFAPFNIRNINNLLFVTYAMQDEGRADDVAGAGHGFIDIYDTTGNLVRRFASQGPLNAPWGLALAPANFGSFGGALLVGNTGDGHINGYNLENGAFLGALANENGTPLTLPTLWSLAFGNGHEGGASDTLFFTAGVDYEQHGLFGAIQAPERRGADTAGSGSFDPTAPGEPGDYPLSPSGGPAFRAGSDRPILFSDLLPLRESFLALIPTLISLAQPDPRPETSVPAGRIVETSFSGSPLAVAPASNRIILLSADRDSQPMTGAGDDVLPLNTFLDLNASANASPGKAGLPGEDLDRTGARSSPLTNRHAATKETLGESHSEEFKAGSSQEQGSEATSQSNQAHEILQVPWKSRHESAEERAIANEGNQTLHGDAWTKLTNILVVVSIAMICAYWPGDRIGPPREEEPLPQL